MVWNYRIIAHDVVLDKDDESKILALLDGDDVCYALHEVYYDNETMCPHSWTANPVSISTGVAGPEDEAEARAELSETFDRVKASLEKPILKLSDLMLRRDTLR